MSADEDRAEAGASFVHATAVLVGEAGILIRGPSGSGKSSLALLLVAEARRRGLFARLVGDDRIGLQAHGGAVVARCHPAIQGLLECRTRPIARVSFEASCVVKLVVDLCAESVVLPRLGCENEVAPIEGVSLPLLRLQAPPRELSCHLVFEKLFAV